MGKEAPAPPAILTPAESPEDTTGPIAPVRREDASALVRSTAIMSIGTALSRLTGFLRVGAMAFALGVAETRLADAYNVANNLPNIVYELVLGGILSSVFVPVFVEQLVSRKREDAWHAARAVMTLAALILGVIMVLGILAAPWIVRLYTFRVEGPAREASQELATLFLRFFMPQIVFYGLGAIASGLLNAHRRFGVPMFAPILNNVVVIVAMLAFAFMTGPETPSPGGITLGQKLVLAIGTTGGVMAMTMALWPSLRRLGFRFRFTLDLRHQAVRRLMRLSGWVAAQVTTNQLALLFVIILASRVRGGYSAYVASFIFFQLPHAIVVVSIITALSPSLAERWIEGDRENFRRILVRGIRASAFIVIPATAGYLVLATPIIRLLLEHGVATGQSTELTSGVLTFFVLALFPFSAFYLMLRAFYAMQDTRTPMLINVFAVALNIGTNFLYIQAFGVKGLALGYATAYTFAAIAAGAILRRRLGGIEGRALASGLGRTVLGAAITAAGAWGAAKAVTSVVDTTTFVGQVLEVGGGVAAGLLLFIGAALLLRIEEFALIRRAVAERLRR
ncbi:MAG: murein biosynthesis integral membrane protein MurJ [Actinomycetota bacterium]